MLCNDECEIVVYVADDFNDTMYPVDCAREHEKQHIKDLPRTAGCKKTLDGCCTEANMAPDTSDYGGKDKLKASECRAYLVTAKCCTRKAGLLNGGAGDANTKEDMKRYRTCVLNAKYQATKKLNYVSNNFGSVCDNGAEFDKLLELFENYFQHNITTTRQ